MSTLKIDHVTTTAYKPSTNGLVERFHRTLNSILGKVVADNQRDWDQHVPYTVAAYRATVHQTTGWSPNYLFLGREVQAPLDIVMGTAPSDGEPNVNEFVEDNVEKMKRAYRLVREQLGEAASRQKHKYDLRVKTAEFQPGDRVWY